MHMLRHLPVALIGCFPRFLSMATSECERACYPHTVLQLPRVGRLATAPFLRPASRERCFHQSRSVPLL